MAVDFNEIRKLIELEGGKFIIMENGKPILVVASFEDYKKRLKLIPQETTGERKEKGVLQGGPQKPLLKELQEGLTIDDLPF